MFKFTDFMRKYWQTIDMHSDFNLFIYTNVPRKQDDLTKQIKIKRVNQRDTTVLTQKLKMGKCWYAREPGDSNTNGVRIMALFGIPFQFIDECLSIQLIS